MSEKPWSVRALRFYYPPRRENVAAALGDLLTLRGIQVTLAGLPGPGELVERSGRQPPLSFVFDPHEVFGRAGLRVGGVVGPPRLAAGRYFVYITDELPRKGARGYSGLVAQGLMETLRGALCVYTTFMQNLDGYADGCTTRVLPPPPVPFPARPDGPRHSDLVFCGVPDERQRRVIGRIEEQWRVRRTGTLHGAALTDMLSQARVVVMPRSATARLLPVCNLSEIMLSGALVVSEEPLLERPRVYDDRVMYVKSSEDPGDLGRKFSTAVTSAMLGRRPSTSRAEIERVEMALLQVTHDALSGLGRPGALPAFLSAVRGWMGAPSVHGAIRWLCEEPGQWRALETRTMDGLTQSIPPLRGGVGGEIAVVCLHTGDPEACMTSLRGATAAFPQHQHYVCCGRGEAPAVANALAATGAPHVQVLALPEAGDHDGTFRIAVRQPAFWKKIESEFALVYSDTLLLRSSRLEGYMDQDLLQHSPSENLHLAFVRVEAIMRSLGTGPVSPDGEFIPVAGLTQAPPEVSDRLARDVFPSPVSVVPGGAGYRPPGLRIAVVDSVNGEEDSPGNWQASSAMALLMILGAQVTVFSAVPARRWVEAMLEAWGQRRHLYGLACLPHTALGMVRDGEFDLALDFAGERGPSLRRRMCERQWLFCMDPMESPEPWWSSKQVRAVFDRVVSGSVANHDRARSSVADDDAMRGVLALAPVPHYWAGRAKSDATGSSKAFVCTVRTAKDGCFVALAFSRAALGPSTKLTILLDSSDPVTLAEVQAECGETARVVAGAKEEARRSALRAAKHAILLGDSHDMTLSGGMPREVLEAIQEGCLPLWRDGSPASLVLADRIHGAAFADQRGFGSLLRAAVSGKPLRTAEGAQDSLGIVSLHSPVTLRHALVSLVLGGRGTVDTGLLGDGAEGEHTAASRFQEEEEEEEEDELDGLGFLPDELVLPPLPPPPAPSRAQAPVRAPRRRLRMVLGF